MGTKIKWISSKMKGVRYREHTTRKHGAKFDRYYVVRYQVGGKRREESLGWSSQVWTEAKAFAEIQKLKDNYQSGNGPISRQEQREIAEEQRQEKQAKAEQDARDNLTFGNLMAEYLEWAKANKKHWGNDEYRYRVHLKKYLENKPLAEINAFFLEGIKSKLVKKGLAPATIKHCLVVIRQVFNKALLWGHWDKANPIKGVKLPKVANAKQRVLTEDEEIRLMTALRLISPDVYGMSMTSLYAGLRFQEVANLHWADINIKEGRLYVRAGKGGTARTVPLCDTLKQVLIERQGLMQAKGLVFPSTKGEIRTKVSATFPRVVTRLGLNKDKDRRFKVDFHSLRHSFASRLASNGTPITVLRDLLGHSDLQMTSRYSHLIPGVADQAVNGLDRPDTNGKVLDLRIADSPRK